MSAVIEQTQFGAAETKDLYVLKPFSREEAMDVSLAADQAGISIYTMKAWARRGLGRVVAGKILVSRVALAAYLDDDVIALAEYQRGYRNTPRVAAIYRRLGIPIIPNIQIED